jgi:cell division GTPase FtsZ
LGAAFDESLEGAIRVSVVATGVDENVSTLQPEEVAPNDMVSRAAEMRTACVHR